MIIIRIKGGLGNQLFQYAFAYSVCKRCNQELALDYSLTNNMTKRELKLNLLKIISFKLVEQKELPFFARLLKNKYINKFFRLIRIKKHKCGRYTYFLETSDHFFKECLNTGFKDCYFDGYFQSPLYFEEFREDLLKQFQPNYPLSSSFLKHQTEIENCNSVAIHIRRGDFKKDKSKYHYLLQVDYYKQAIDYISTRVNQPVFYFFSNDIKWTSDNFKFVKNAKFISLNTDNSDIEELFLMSKCKHIISANSTYSWWAAWLNNNKGALIVVPSKDYGMKTMIPDKWIRI